MYDDLFFLYMGSNLYFCGKGNWNMETNINTLKNRLLNYINTTNIVFQFRDGLVEVANSEFSEDSTKEMLCAVKNAKQIKNVSPDEIISPNDTLGFNDLAQWSQKSDKLYCVDEPLLLCVGGEG